jgi:hypothetical protein
MIKTDQCNIIHSLEINPYLFSQLFIDKGAKNMQLEKDSLFNKWCWENKISTCWKMKQLLSQTIYKNQLKTDWRCKTWNCKITRRKQKKSLTSIREMIFRYDPKSTGNKNKNKQVGLHQTIKILHSKRNNWQRSLRKVTYTMGEKFVHHLSDKELIL